MPKYKTVKDLSELAKALTKPKRPRIVRPTPKQYEPVNYVIRQRLVPETPKGSIQEADQLMNDLDRTIIQEGYNSKLYPRSLRRVVYNAAKNGTYGPNDNNFQRMLSEQIVNTPDFFRYGPNNLGGKIDRDLKNATSAYDVIGLNHRQQSPGLAKDFLNSALEEAETLIAKPLRPTVRTTKTTVKVSPEAWNEMMTEEAIAEQGAAKKGLLGRPVTTIQPDMERFYVPNYYNDYVGEKPIYSTYDTTEPESFTDFYRRLTGYTGKLLDKNGGKLNGMKKTR